MEIKKGDRYLRSTIITEGMISGFAESTGDKNPVHLDQAYAEGTIFKNRIAHGMLMGGLISALLGNEYPGNGTIYISQSLAFLAPVYIGDEITVEVEVTGILEKNRVELRTDCHNQEGKVVVKGQAVVLPPRGTVVHQ